MFIHGGMDETNKAAVYETISSACERIEQAAGLMRDAAPNLRNFAAAADGYAAQDAHMAKVERLNALIAELAEIAIAYRGA